MRIDDYSWKDLPPDLVEWLGEVTDLLNGGRYSVGTMNPPSASTPGLSGDHFIGKDGSTWYLYIYTDITDKWLKTQLFAL